MVKASPPKNCFYHTCMLNINFIYSYDLIFLYEQCTRILNLEAQLVDDNLLHLIVSFQIKEQ